MTAEVGTLEALLETRAVLTAEREDINSRLHATGQAIEAYMRDMGAEERVTFGGYRVTYKRPAVWDKTRLVPLLEAVPLEQLIEAKAYTPEHMVSVPAAFDLTRLKPFARYSADAARIIESAQSLGNPELKVEKAKP